MGNNDSDYSERIVAFIDILGFKNHVYDSINTDYSTNIENFNKIQSALDLIIDIADNESPMNKNREVIQFSDSIIISFLINEKSEVFYTLIGLLYLIIELLQYGYLIRGGISLGKCFHSDTRVFGPAVIQAVELEKKATYPRIIIDKKVLQKGCENHVTHHSSEDESKYLKHFVKEDDDGEFYLNYFSSALSEFDDEFQQLSYIESLESLIQSNLIKYKDNTRVLDKYEWMKQKYNNMINHMKSKENINRIREFKSEIADWLESRSLIT